MVDVLIKHTVEDYDDWKPYFDENASARMESGSQGYRLFRTSEDPNDLAILFEWDSAENARQFFEESDVREIMQKAGVVGKPEISYLDEVEAKMPETPAA